jgi:hypothetical protein
MAGLRNDVKSVSTSNRSSVQKGTMITMVPIMTNLTNNVHSKGGGNAGGVKAFSHDLKRMHWPLNFKPSGIEKYIGSTNPDDCLKGYQLTIEAAGGDPYVMANYLSVCLSSNTRTWLLGDPAGLVCSWNH